MLPADSLGISRDSAFLFTEIDGSALGASFGRVLEKKIFWRISLLKTTPAHFFLAVGLIVHESNIYLLM